MSIFTRESVHLKWSGYEKAFHVIKNEYSGDIEDKPAAYGRGLWDGGLLIVSGITTPRKFQGVVFGYDTASGTDGGISYGNIDHLKLAWAATDLECKAFGDAAYWNAEWIGSWTPVLEYDPMRNYASIPVILVER